MASSPAERNGDREAQAPISNEGEEPPSIREQLRQWEKNLVAELGNPDPRIEEFYMEIPLPDGRGLRSKVWRPSSASPTTTASTIDAGNTPEGRPQPLILLFHGGGYNAGSPEMCTIPGRDFALRFSAVVVASPYALSPEHAFPAAARDGLAAASWLARNAASRLGANPAGAGFIVGGFSAGGVVAAVVASEARGGQLKADLEGAGTRITGAYLCVPLFFDEDTVPRHYKELGLWTSRTENAGAMLNADSVRNIIRDTKSDTSSPLFCPVHHPERGLEGYPRTYMQVGNLDFLRDDGVVFGRCLADAGVETRVDVLEGVGHAAYCIFTQVEKEETARLLRESAMAGMAWLLEQDMDG